MCGPESSYVGNPLNTKPEKDARGRFMNCYNRERVHAFLNRESGAMPTQVLVRKMAPNQETSVDQQVGAECRAGR